MPRDSRQGQRIAPRLSQTRKKRVAEGIKHEAFYERWLRLPGTLDYVFVGGLGRLGMLLL